MLHLRMPCPWVTKLWKTHCVAGGSRPSGGDGDMTAAGSSRYHLSVPVYCPVTATLQ